MIIDFPSTLTLVTGIEWGQLRRDLAFDSPFSSQSAELSHPLWTVLLTPARYNRAEYAQWESLLLQLDGRQNQLALWHIDRPQPRGTMRGVMTLNGAHAAGATTLNISAGAGEAGKTLLAGDHLGLGSGTSQQVCKVQADATADGSGNITVQVRAALRTAFVTGSAVTWDKPKALFRRTDSRTSMRHQRGGVDGTSLDLVEDWR
jgi:hypothetical protein